MLQFKKRLFKQFRFSILWRKFGIRQVATTVPEPGAMLLLGFGLLGLAGYGIHRKKKNS